MAKNSFEADGCDVTVVNFELCVGVSGNVGIDEDYRSEDIMSIGISVAGVDDAPMVITSGIAIGV